MFSVLFAVISLLALTFGAVGVTPAYATTGASLIVNIATDEDASNSNCSLREAIIAANNNADYNGCTGTGTYGADTITFVANYTITLASQLPAVTTDITITGNGAANTVINANAGSGSQRRAFYVKSTGNLTLNGLTVQNGYCTGSCATLDSDLASSSGGGVYNKGTLALTNSAFSGNFASFGGGAWSNGALTITNSTFSGNGNSASYGGGVRNAGTLTITNSTFSGNSAFYGGGVENYSGTLTITNSTFSGNSATYGGGGGNIDNYSGTVTLKNAIVANYTSGGDCAGAITADAYNLDSDGSCGGAIQKTGLEIKLGALADNGGPTQTLALLPGSVAIDAGDDTVCDDNPGPNNLDQRGVTRPHGAHCDIGAFEQTGSNFIVNSSADTDDGVCGANCTLREAINAANAISGADTITFDAGYTITLGSQLPAVNTYITITGSGAANTIIQASDCNPITLKDSSNADCAAAAYRVFQVISGGNLTLDSLTVRHGNSADYGGGVCNAGTLTVTNSTFSGNSASYYGGGISNINGTLTVTNSTFSGNSASIIGGGIYNQGALTVTNSTFSENSATGGGGIYNNGSGTLTITNSSFYWNFADDGGGNGTGGGVRNAGTLTITNSSFFENSADYGGGVYNSGGTLTVTNSTFSGNSASYGGGILNYSTTTLKNTIVANSTGGGDCYGAITADAYNLDSDGSCGGATQKTSLEINLGALADNGGPTQTFALLPGSAAIDAGDDTVCDDNPGPNNLDQRGVTRVGNGAHCDIGAFEAEAQPGPTFIVNTNADTDDRFCDTLGSGVGNKDCTLREAINAANMRIGTDAITFAGDYTITLNGSQLPAVTSGSTITITGNGADNTIIQASACNPVTDSCSHDYRVFEVTSAGNLTLNSLTVQHGRFSNGGGAYNAGVLTMTNSTFSANKATTGSGGGVYNSSGTLSVTDSTFSDNNAFGNGGGIRNNGTLAVTNSTFSNNSTSGGYGGGIANNNARTLTVTNSTFFGNSARDGGGIDNVGTLTVTNSTFSANSATAGSGGGIYSSGTLNLYNTILANSTSGSDCYNLSTVNGDHNLIELNISCGTPLITDDPNLGSLTDNGGSTQTFALLPGSVAIDAGDDTVCDDAAPGPDNLDQRGVSRVGNGAHCDIGAYETEAQPGPTFIVNTNADTNDLSCDTLGSGIGNKDCTLREAINAANAISGADIITFDISLNGTPITLVGSQLPAVTSEITITGNGAEHTIIQASACNPVTLLPEGCLPVAYRVFAVSAGGDLTLDSLTARHGKTNNNGGGVANSGTLTITNSAFSGNYAANYGGGVYNNIGTLTITNSAFSGNSAGISGGGAYNYAGALTITNSTFSGNSAGTSGGGVLNDGPPLTITNSTFSDNSATYGGGIRDNGGISILKNTIVANSTSGADCSGSITADTFNLDSDGSCGGATQKTSLEINLGDLDDYGGSTETFALLPGSAAIDAGDTTVCDDAAPGPNNLDQRGVSRVGNGDHCDIGAYESRGFTLTKTGGDNQSAIINAAFTDPLSVTLNETGGSVLSGAVITFTAPSSGASITSPNETAPTNASGIASISVTANGTVGSYNVTASVVGASVDFTLSNTTTYTLTYTAGANGSITAPTDPSPVTYNNGTSVPITAEPAVGYHFVNWTGDTVADANAASTTITMNGNYVITANFAINTYDLTYTAGVGGTIDGTTPQTVNSGESGTEVTAVADPGYHFVGWSDGVLTASRTDMNVTGNVSVTADFAIDTYDLTYTAGANGSITGDSPQTVISGADGTAVTAVADAGYHFVDWSDASTANPRTDTAVSGDISVTANFAINTIVTVLSTNSQDGWILESGAHTSKGGTMSSSTPFRVGDDAADKQYRNILSFSTGVKLPDTATIIKVTLRLKKYGSVVGAVSNPVSTFKGFLMYVKKGYFGTSAFVASDFQASTSGSHTYRSTPSLVSGWYNIDLTAIKDHINKTSSYSSLTQIRLQFYTADNGNKKANYLQLYGGSSAYRPQLVIEYVP